MEPCTNPPPRPVAERPSVMVPVLIIAAGTAVAVIYTDDAVDIDVTVPILIACNIADTTSFTLKLRVTFSCPKALSVPII